MTTKVTNSHKGKTKKNTFRCRNINAPAFEGVVFYICDFNSGPRGRGFKSRHSDQKVRQHFGVVWLFLLRDLKDERNRATVRWTVVTASDQAAAAARVKSRYSDQKMIIRTLSSK